MTINSRNGTPRSFCPKAGKVKAEVRFKGREMLHTSLGRLKLERLATDLAEIADVEQPPRMETRVMLMILTPNSSQKSP